MRIITPKAVKSWVSEHADAAKALARWMNLVEEAEWRSFAEMRAALATADELVVASGRRVAVFNIGGNKYRLIAAVHYDRQIVYAMLFLAHAEYDKDQWKEVL